MSKLNKFNALYVGTVKAILIILLGGYIFVYKIAKWLNFHNNIYLWGELPIYYNGYKKKKKTNIFKFIIIGFK